MIHYLQTPNWPIRLLSLLCLSLTNITWAHDVGSSDIPEDAGWVIGIGAAAAYAKQTEIAEQSIPSVLDAGSAHNDLQGWRFEHATISAGVRVNRWIGAQLAVGWHDQDEMHWESAWLELQSNQPGSNWRAGAGKNTVPIGDLWQQAGHLDRFMQQPLVKQAFFNGDWIANGVSVRWERDQSSLPWLKQISISGWQQDEYPADKSNNSFPVLSVSLNDSSWTFDAYASTLKTSQRKSDLAKTSHSHSHDSSGCSVIQENVACFKGRSHIAGASLTWQTPIESLQLRWAGAIRKEKGQLTSTASLVDYQANSWGGWIEPSWVITPQWEAALRYEWLKGNNTLKGAGASLLARQTRLSPNQGAERSSIIIGWRPEKSWLLTLEGGLEASAGKDNRYVALRAVWQMPKMISGHF